jgi:hypothetical protein
MFFYSRIFPVFFASLTACSKAKIRDGCEDGEYIVLSGESVMMSVMKMKRTMAMAIEILNAKSEAKVSGGTCPTGNNSAKSANGGDFGRINERERTIGALKTSRARLTNLALTKQQLFFPQSSHPDRSLSATPHCLARHHQPPALEHSAVTQLWIDSYGLLARHHYPVGFAIGPWRS